LLHGETLKLQNLNVLFPRTEEQRWNMCKIQQHTCRQLSASVWKKENSMSKHGSCWGKTKIGKRKRRPVFYLLYLLIRPDLITRPYPKLSGVLKPWLIVCYR